MRDIIVSVYDSRKLVKVLDMLYKFRALVKGVDEDSGRVDGIIIADGDGLRYMAEMHIEISGIVLNIDSIGVEKGAVRSVILSRSSSIRVNSIVIGIDYGRRIGVAVLVDSDIVFINSYRDKAEALKIIEMFIDSIDVERKIVRIGLPSKPNREYDDFIARLLNVVKERAVVEFIIESGSSKRKIGVEDMRIDDDSLAAINIALQRVYSDRV